MTSSGAPAGGGGRLPRRLGALLGEAAAALAWALGIRRAIALANLRRAFPERTEGERRALARAAYRNLGRMAGEFLLAPPRSPEEAAAALVLEGRERLDAALAEGRGVIACAGHLGHFELLAAAHGQAGVPLTVITRRLGGGLGSALWRRARARGGFEELVGRRGRTLWAARRALARGRALACLVDQNQPSPRAAFPLFFGAPAATARTPAVLALRTGAPVFFVATVPLGGGRHRVVYEGPLPVGRSGDRARDELALLQELTRRLERWVRAHPDHWFWLHRRWKTRPPGEPDPGGASPAQH